MGETTNEIETHIVNERDRLGSNLHQLEERVKAAVDWRQRFRTRPMPLLGVAFGGGVLIGALAGGRKHGRDYLRF